MLAKITKIPRSEYRPFPPLFSDSNGGHGDKKKMSIMAMTGIKIHFFPFFVFSLMIASVLSTRAEKSRQALYKV